MNEKLRAYAIIDRGLIRQVHQDNRIHEEEILPLLDILQCVPAMPHWANSNHNNPYLLNRSHPYKIRCKLSTHTISTAALVEEYPFPRS